MSTQNEHYRTLKKIKYLHRSLFLFRQVGTKASNDGHGSYLETYRLIKMLCRWVMRGLVR